MKLGGTSIEAMLLFYVFYFCGFIFPAEVPLITEERLLFLKKKKVPLGLLHLWLKGSFLGHILDLCETLQWL